MLQWGDSSKLACHSGLQRTLSFIRALVSLSSGYQPQSNGQTEQANQDMELALHFCPTSTGYSSALAGVHTQHPRQCRYRYASFHGNKWLSAPFVPQAGGQNNALSVWDHVQRCCRIWQTARSVPPCRTNAWRTNIARQLLVESVAFYIGSQSPDGLSQCPFDIIKMINPAVTRLKCSKFILHFMCHFSSQCLPPQHVPTGSG